MRPRTRPWLIPAGSPPVFPDPAQADDEGLLAVGGDLSPERLLMAYAHGIFPWYDVGMPPLWWSPNPRAVVDAESLHVSRSMRRELKKFTGKVTYDQAFERVMHACAERGNVGTWILPEVVRAYRRLHELGHAHSIEIWQGEELVGGLYGVHLGGLFAAESMFHRHANASKLAFIISVFDLFALGIQLFDVQFMTPHLASLGVYPLPRNEYLKRVHQAVMADVELTGLGEHPRRLARGGEPKGSANVWF